ncbi:homocysteine-responsive endoplasmic reticulum-resident ubiquitin-like domain member 2 protein isoform X3 [Pteronotus mesoamericanus]|uniref:homocysteine-responsive endoplasmic reticulum-resident ubiquitin-like domain member 2 protein isoform X3 n=1 Tax=Pteronotus mesoamericanus TaxID=1884717 RepID=UPI0023EB8349|nr:homocysteine-responsive endoplasmic reticulum-resident ubiquitin-like domain member 2 protein isoform X3 [Pteronotus parnellii mesoamericanus]
MDQSGMEIPVTLIIKAPNQKYRDQTISCFLNWTVGKLKTHLSNVYPSKPSSDQSGSTTPSSSPETLPLAVSASTEGLRQRVLPQVQTNPAQSRQFPYVLQGNVDNQLPGQAAAAGFPVYPAFSPLQALWWQQMYAHRYYMQYQAAVSAQATSDTAPAQPAPSQPLNLAHVPGEEPPPAPNLVARENRPVNENVQMNAQGGPVLNEEDFNRDWLDWLYTFSRAAVLLSIVYFYSSFSRFVMVMGAMLLVYLHQAGWFPFRQEVGQQQAPRNNAEVNDGQDANNLELEEMERLMDDGLEDESGEDAGDAAGALPRPGLMASAWSFITTFFTSLIPEGPPQAAN